MFHTGAALELATVGVMAVALAETLPSTRKASLRASEFLQALRRIVSPAPRLRSFYLGVSIDLFGLLSREYGFTPL